MKHEDVNHEKTSLLPTKTIDPQQQHESQQTIRTRYLKTGIQYHFYILALIFTWWCLVRVPVVWRGKGVLEPIISEDGVAVDKPVGFDDITPSEKLQWHSCYAEPFKCARLTVPMDYDRPLNSSEDNPKVHLALLLVPGVHLGSKKASTSPLLINPGGPGGSGTTFALSAGSSIQTIVSSGSEVIDVIGFDPRGIGATWPKTDCFSFPYEDPAYTSGTEQEEDYARGDFHRKIWNFQAVPIGFVNSTADSFRQHDIRSKAETKLCKEKDLLYGEDSIFRYANTANVARDMISIIDAWDEWTKSLEDEVAENNGAELENTVADQEENDHASTKSKLVYWGFSYGTVLGAQFAAMFPDRVGRMALDGVVDFDDYSASFWRKNLRNSDDISDSFAKYCHDGKEQCALYRDGDKVTDVENRFNIAIKDVTENPIISIDQTTMSPVTIDLSLIRMILFLGLYSPIRAWESIAFVINLLYTGQREIVAQAFSSSLVYDLKPLCVTPVDSAYYPNEAQRAIMCTDKRHPLNETLPGLERMFEELTNVSSWSDIWMTILLTCNGWSIKAADVSHDLPVHVTEPIKTSHPMLFLSNTFDPVTPLYGGVKMAKRFVDAGFLEQKSMGHCTLSAVSLCTVGKLRTYFATGDTPPPPEGDKWETCEADEWPFHKLNGAEYLSSMGAEALVDMKTLNSLDSLQETFSKLKHLGQPTLPFAGLDLSIFN